eukprot:3133192-Rhodomonas_salina.5
MAVLTLRMVLPRMAVLTLRMVLPRMAVLTWRMVLPAGQEVPEGADACEDCGVCCYRSGTGAAYAPVFPVLFQRTLLSSGS